ncbi:MAG: DinB family protein [Anaerolineae bacterium]|nr:DinB family protein [Anaerolineae bacterium]
MPTDIAQEISATVDAASAALRQIGEADTSAIPEVGRWSKKQIIGHLLDSASNNHHRFVRAQQQQSAVFTFPGYEQEAWVSAQAYESSSWAELVELWRLYNRHLAHVIEHMPEDKLGVECQIESNESVSLGRLIEDYLKHMKHHLAQLGVI